MPLQHVCQIGFVQVGLLQELFDARLVLGAADAGSNGDDVFGPENLGGHVFVVQPFRLAHGFLSQSGSGKKLDGKAPQQKVFPLNLPALRL